MTTTQQAQAPPRSSTPTIPAQRQAVPLRVGVPAPRRSGPRPARPDAVPGSVPRGRTPQPWPVTVGGLVAALALGTLATLGAPDDPTGQPVGAAPASDEGFVANVSVPGRVLTSFGDGTWQVGVDVAPGTYTTAGAVDPECRHAVRTSATVDDPVEGSGDRGPATVVLREDDGWFVTAGCATWRRTG